jgi:hypothetical protein
MQFPEENLNELENIAVHDVLGHGGTFSGFVFNDDMKAVFVVNPRHGYVKLSKQVLSNRLLPSEGSDLGTY